MSETDPHARAEELEQEADQLEGQNRTLEDKTDDVRQDWERKRRDESVPGAPPPEGKPEGDVIDEDDRP